jgi:(2Fe-2S) ferredoxin
MRNSGTIEACFVCVNTSCRRGGSEQILRSLGEKLTDSTVQVREQICFGACWMGPNVVLHPAGTWYCGVGTEDVADIVCHIKGGIPVARLIDESDPGLHEQVVRALKSAIG